MITNYTINQPFTSNFSVEEGEENSSRTCNHGAARIVNHVETFFTQKPEKSVEGKPYVYSCNTVKANSFRAGQTFLYLPEQHFSMSLSLDSIRLVWFPSMINKRQEKLKFLSWLCFSLNGNIGRQILTRTGVIA